MENVHVAMISERVDSRAWTSRDALLSLVVESLLIGDVDRKCQRGTRKKTEREKPHLRWFNSLKPNRQASRAESEDAAHRKQQNIYHSTDIWNISPCYRLHLLHNRFPLATNFNSSMQQPNEPLMSSRYSSSHRAYSIDVPCSCRTPQYP